MSEQMDIWAKIEEVNQLLQAGEPANISEDRFSGYTGYDPQAIKDAMNRVFGIGKWGFKEISSEIAHDDKGSATLIVAKVEVWLAGVEWRPEAWGQNRITKGDIGDARKGAGTDALKKALSNFSIGNRAYLGLLPPKKQQAQPATSQPAERTTNANANAKNQAATRRPAPATTSQQQASLPQSTPAHQQARTPQGETKLPENVTPLPQAKQQANAKNVAQEPLPLDKAREAARRLFTKAVNNRVCVDDDKVFWQFVCATLKRDLHDCSELSPQYVDLIDKQIDAEHNKQLRQQR